MRYIKFKQYASSWVIRSMCNMQLEQCRISLGSNVNLSTVFPNYYFFGYFVVMHSHTKCVSIQIPPDTHSQIAQVIWLIVCWWTSELIEKAHTQVSFSHSIGAMCAWIRLYTFGNTVTCIICSLSMNLYTQIQCALGFNFGGIAVCVNGKCSMSRWIRYFPSRLESELCQLWSFLFVNAIRIIAQIHKMDVLEGNKRIR